MFSGISAPQIVPHCSVDPQSSEQVEYDVFANGRKDELMPLNNNTAQNWMPLFLAK